LADLFAISHRLIAALAISEQSAAAHHDEIISASTEQLLRQLYRQLIDAENAHDIAAVKRLVWQSPSVLFVAKTKTAAEGNWAGFWGADGVVNHINELLQGVFSMDPDYGREKLVAGGQERIIIPTAYRIDYLTALNAFSRNAEMTPLLRMLDYAQRYTHAIDWSTLDHARAMLEESGAFGTGEDSKLHVNWQKWEERGSSSAPG
jgi:hypothetical protein